MKKGQEETHLNQERKSSAGTPPKKKKGKRPWGGQGETDLMLLISLEGTKLN